jgi:tRNA-specific 2-thiouridylase
MRIVVAMSGGVDSSVAAALVRARGDEAVGVSMQLYDQREVDGRPAFGSCCTLDDLADARRVASHLGIPHYIVNLEQQFEREVVSNFVREYARGRTPLPCAHCNTDLKFEALVDRADAFAAERVATGHYARITRNENGRLELRRGVDANKDQSYFLFGLTQAQLARAEFPVGELTKAAVREQARELGLTVAGKRDSQEICFVPDNDYARFVDRHLPDAPRPGFIRDADGRTLGRHEGVHRYTVGQRKGLGLSSPQPLYVVELQPESATVVVGTREALERREFVVGEVNWIAGSPPELSRSYEVQIRHRHQPVPAMLSIDGDGLVTVACETPLCAVTPGQAAVFYDGEMVVGGGWIS